MSIWQFTESFHRADPARVRRLERAKPIEAIVHAILKPRPTVEINGLKAHPTIGSRRQRVEFCIRTKPDLLDAFFNGPTGYRAEFLRSEPEAGDRIDRRIIERIADAYVEEIKRIPDGWKSIGGSQAKVWIRQGKEHNNAIRGLTRAAPDIDVPSWIERMDEAVDTPRGPRWLARAGVIASLGRLAIDVKGGWIEDGELIDDGYKGNNRPQQIRMYGFT